MKYKLNLYIFYDNKICSTKKCLDTSSLILNSLDSSVDPCDNFYRFACGNWIVNILSFIYNNSVDIENSN